jgi:tetratricopeptide (TPR) repeat protein
MGRARRLLRAVWTIAFVVGSLAAMPAPALAQDDDKPADATEEKGRKLAQEAMAHYQKQEYDKALDVFNKAKEVYPTAQVLRMTGYTLMALQRWVEAADLIEQAIKSDNKPLMPRDAEHAEDQLKEVLKHVSNVTLRSDVKGAKVRIDGGDAKAMPLTVRLKAGSHTFVASAEGHEDVERDEDLSEGKDATFLLNPTKKKPKAVVKPVPVKKDVPKEDEEEEEEEEEPKKKDEPSGPSEGLFPYQGTVGLALAGVGLALGGVAIASGAYGGSLRSAADENLEIHNTRYDPECRANSELCLYDLALINRDIDQAQSFTTTAIATGIAGGVLLAGGLTLWLLSPDGPGGGGQEKAGGDGKKGARGPLPSGWSCLPAVAPPGGEGAAPATGLGCFGRF